MNSDGSIIIDTKINTDGIANGERRLQKEFERVADSAEKTGEKIKSSFERTSSFGYDPGAMEAVFGSAAADIRNYSDAVKRYGSSAGMVLNQMDPAGEKAAGALKDVAQTGEQVTEGLKKIKGSGANEPLKEISTAGSKTSTVLQRLSEIAKSTSKLMRTVGEEEKTTARSGDRLAQSVNKTNVGFKKMFSYAFGIRSLFALFNRIRGAVTDGMKNIVQYSDSTNRAVSGLMASLTQLKNALATAFAPILTAVAPALNYLIGLLTSAATAVAQLFAALTGQSTFIKATKVQEDYAASLKKTGSAAKKAEKSLASFDTIEQIGSKGKDSGSGSGGSDTKPADMFETTAIEEKIQKMASRIKEILGTIFQPLKNAWIKEGQTTIESAKRAFSKLSALAKSVGSSMMEVWTNGSGERMAETVLQIVQGIMDVLGNITESLRNAWDMNELGTSIIQNIANILQIMLSFISGIVQATVRWSAALNLSPLLEGVNVLLGASGGLIRSIGTFLEKLYSGIILPMFSYLLQSGLPALMKMLASVFDVISENQAVVDVIGASIITAFAAWKLIPFAAALLEVVANIAAVVAAMIGSGGALEAITVLVSALGGPLLVAIGGVVAAAIWMAANWEKLSQGMQDAWNATCDIFEHVWEKVLKPVWDTFMEVVDMLWQQHIRPFLSNFNGFITDMINLINLIYSRGIAPAIGWFVDLLGPTIAAILKSAQTVTSGWAAGTIDFINSVITVFRVLIEFLSGVFTVDWEKAWEGIKKIFGGVVSGIETIIRALASTVVNIVNGIISLVESGINGIINGINDLLSGIPDEVPIVGGLHIGNVDVPRVHLPKLASGTVVPPRAGEFAAILGDNKRETEVVSPLSTMKQALLEALMESGMSGGSQQIVIRFEGNLAQLGRVLKPVIDAENNRGSVRLVTGGQR